MSSIDLNLLRTFVSIHETGSLTKTAEILSVTQPSVSHSLSRLRAHFEDPLFQRGRLGMRPTALATALYGSFRDALTRIDHAVDSTVHFDSASSARRFRIALTDVGEMSLLPLILERMAREAPAVELEVVPMEIELVAEWLRSGRVDAAIASTPIPGELESTVFMEDTYACLVRDDFPLVDGRMSMESFLSGRHAVVAAITGHRLAEQAIERLGLTRKTTVVLHHFSVLPHIVEKCDLIAIIPRGTAGSIEQRWPLKLVELPFDVHSFEVRLYWQAHEPESAAAVWFRTVVLESLAPPGADRMASTSEDGTPSP